jgi:thioredoxin:protein disulfide reductase
MGSFEEAMARGIGWAFLTVFGAGVLTSLTPCVYPMIPITVSIFGAKEAKSRATSFLLALAYVNGMAAMYSGLGVVAALGGWAAGSLLASPVFVILLSLLFIALALSMFGLWEMRIPFWLQSRISSVGGKGYGGAFAMGLVGGILIAPCTGPVLAALLGYVATTRNVVLGVGLLYTYALGIGVLFFVIATFSVSLPKSGTWMESVKSVLGIALLVGALYYLQNVSVTLSLFSSASLVFAGLCAGCVVLGVLLGAIHLPFRGRGALSTARKAVGILLVTAGLFGGTNFVLAPRAKLPWLHDEPRALALARGAGKPVFVDFWARWCAPCKLMESTVMQEPSVRRELDRFVLLKVDVTDETDRDKRLRAKYRAGELPQLVVLDAEGTERGRAGKLSDAEEMIRLLRKAR